MFTFVLALIDWIESDTEFLFGFMPPTQPERLLFQCIMLSFVQFKLTIKLMALSFGDNKIDVKNYSVLRCKHLLLSISTEFITELLYVRQHINIDII